MAILSRTADRGLRASGAEQAAAAAPATSDDRPVRGAAPQELLVLPAQMDRTDLQPDRTPMGTAGFAPYLALVRGVLSVPRAAVLLLPAPAGAADPLPALEGFHPSDDPRVVRLARAVAESGEALAHGDLGELAPRESEGGPARVAAFAGVPLCADEGSVRGCLCALDGAPRDWSPEEVQRLRDVAAIAARELGIRAAAAELRTLENVVRTLGKAVENMQLGVTVTDLEGKIIYTNPAEARMHGYEVGELTGQHARILGPPEAGRALEPTDLQRTTSWTRETVNVRRDGTRFPVLLWSDLVTDAEGRLLGIVTCSEDVTERKRAEQALREIALRDALTSLPNRTFFLERLTHAIDAFQHDPTARFAVLFLDLDRFKVVNDSLGHHVGDELLRVVAARLQGCLQSRDIVARFGGDEFAVLVDHISGVEEATRLAQAILAAVSAPIHLEGYELFTSASIGIVLGAAGVEQPEYLWRSADMAMYRAKARGTSQFEIFDHAMHADAVARLQMETDLRRALERQEFALHYQPIVDLASGVTAGFEALLRWNHPVRGMIPPAEVIPVAEEMGLIGRLGDWVLREACRQLSEWKRQVGTPDDLWVGINLSSKQLPQPQLVDRIRAAVLDAGISPRQLKIEITESAILENAGAATETIRQIKSFGVQVFLDDFGTGYSSLSYLHQLPLDALKIDRSFVSEMVPGDRHSHLVRTMVELAHGMGLGVVAEGVSTEEQLAHLREIDCAMVQGFLISRPMPACDVLPFLRARR